MEFLKEQLGEELYNQFVEKMKGSDIKLADLSKGEYVAKGKFDNLQAKYSTLEQTAKDYDEQIKELSKEDAKGLKAKLEDAIKERDTQKADFDKKLADIEFNSKLDGVLSSEKVKNTKALKALLNMDNVKLDGETFIGLNDQLKALKESDSYLFDNNTDAGGGANPANAQQAQPDGDKLSDAEYFANYYNK